MIGWKRFLMRWHISLLALLLPDVTKRLPLRMILIWLTPARPSRLYHGLDEQIVLAMVRQRLARPWRMRGRRCLREGLLCLYFLRLIDVPAVLHFGVFQKVKGREVAHCWVVVRDRCVTPPPQQKFVPILIHPLPLH